MLKLAQCLKVVILLLCTLMMSAAFALNVSVGGDKTWANYLSRAEVIADTQSTESNFLIPLGKNQKVDGRWLLPHSRQFDGVVYRTLYRFESGKTLSQLSQVFAESLVSKGAKIKYECQSRACGSSNFWANDYFFERLLYGANKHQQLWVYQYQQHWYVAYLMQRGNGRIYFQQLKMGIEGSTADTFSLGKRCNIAGQDSALFEFIQVASVGNVNTKNEQANAAPTVRLVLTVSVSSDNAWQDAQTYASACAMRIQKAFDIILFDSLGLGSINFRFNHRVSETEYTLHRFKH